MDLMSRSRPGPTVATGARKYRSRHLCNVKNPEKARRTDCGKGSRMTNGAMLEDEAGGSKEGIMHKVRRI